MPSFHPNLSLKLELKGAKELKAVLAELRRSTRNKILRGAIAKASTPVLKRARQLAPKQHPLDQEVIDGERKPLRQSIVRVIRSYEHTVLGVIGPNAKAWHAHIVEFGTMERWTEDPFRYVGFMPPFPFLRPALQDGKFDFFKILEMEVRARLIREVSRIVARHHNRAT